MFLLLNIMFLCSVFVQECPAGTYKNVTGSDRSLCRHCPYHELPRRAIYISVRGISILMLFNLFYMLSVTKYLLNATWKYCSPCGFQSLLSSKRRFFSFLVSYAL